MSEMLDLLLQDVRVLDIPWNQDDGELMELAYNKITDAKQRYVYSKFCSKNPTGKIPPKELLSLAKKLKIEYDVNNSDWTELCGKIGMVLGIILY